MVIFCHSCASRNPGVEWEKWIPAQNIAGMTRLSVLMAKQCFKDNHVGKIIFENDKDE
jgi:hypothetical protein